MFKKNPLFYREAETVAPIAQTENPQAPEPVIRAHELTKIFRGETAVDHISFEIPPGSIFGFIGPSGSGKTTTIRLLTGYYRPTDGEAKVLGRDPVSFRRRDRVEIGYMPQLFVLYPNLTVMENMNFAASLYGMSPIRGKQIRNVLEFVELYDHRHELGRNLSGGMQRRLSLAATLIHNPHLLFLDEPTAGIDPILRRKFWDRFRELRSQGTTIFITTQYVSEAEYCDLVGVQDSGKLLAVDTPRGIRHRAYGGDILDFITEEPFSYEAEMELHSLPFVLLRTFRTGQNSMHIVVDEASTALPKLLEWAQTKRIKVKSAEEYMPSFEDVFVELVRNQAPSRGEE